MCSGNCRQGRDACTSPHACRRDERWFVDRYGRAFSTIAAVLAIVLGSYIAATLLVAIFYPDLIGMSK